MSNKKETMLEAFLRQTKIDDIEADKRDKVSKDLGDHLFLESQKRQAAMPSMREAVGIPTRLPTQSIPIQKDIPQPGEKGFTEINRWKMLGGKTVTEDGLDDGSIEMGDMGSEDA